MKALRLIPFVLLAAFAFSPVTASARPPERHDPPKLHPRKPETRAEERRREAEEARRQREKTERDRDRERADRERDRDRRDHRSDKRHRHYDWRPTYKVEIVNVWVIERERVLRDRRAEARRDLAKWRRLRAERAEANRRAIYARWYRAVRTDEGRAEFAVYSERMARLHRIRDLAAERRDNTVVVRVDKVITLENNRHSKAITALVSVNP
jgi:hypothetical protein